MATDVDIYVGKRLRRRRRLLGLTQQDLAGQVGVRFQQIQKYECGANRITASRLFSLGTALNVNINYFFEGLAPDGKQAPANDQADRLSGDILSQKKPWSSCAPTTACRNVRAAACSTWQRPWKAIRLTRSPRKVFRPTTPRAPGQDPFFGRALAALRASKLAA